jgi:hypothetical protein
MTNEWQEHRYEDLFLHVRVKLANPSAMDYEVRDLVFCDDGTAPLLKFVFGNTNEPIADVEKATVLIKGFIKWDGCSNNDFSSIHGCSRQEMVRLGELYTRLFDIAMKLMPNQAEEFLT